MTRIVAPRAFFPLTGASRCHVYGRALARFGTGLAAAP